MIANPRMMKLKRLEAGNALRVLDLFAGCGGLSLGFHSAGFDIVGAVEVDPLAAKSHALNFFSNLGEDGRELHARSHDITRVSPDQLVGELQLGRKVGPAADLIIGGPPCQAFARVGRSKLREVFEHPRAFLKDPRANLYLRYLHYVERIQPLAVLVENVPDALNFGGHNIAEEMCATLSDMGYVCAYTLLNSVYYGVPQMRERMFLLGYARELRLEPKFPAPTHWFGIPRGYEGSRQVALRSLGGSRYASSNGLIPGLIDTGLEHFYVKPPAANPDLSPAITAEEALCDLPPITLHLEGKLKRGARRFNELVPYPENLLVTPYGSLMRNWPGFENQAGVRDHVIRYLPRDYAIFRRMNPGDQYPEAYQHALEMFEVKLAEFRREGKKARPGSAQYERLRKSMVPPYDPSKFPNKWRKMEADAPARTLMAHLGKDGYSHIHHDSGQARTISVREAARLQSFPDGFVFVGTMNPAFRQIGEAVPPLLANCLAHTILETLGVPASQRPLVESLAREKVGV